MCLHSQLLRTGSSGHGLEQKQLFGFLPALLSSLGQAFAALCHGIWVPRSSATTSASQKRSCCTRGVRVWGLHREDAPHLGMLLRARCERWSWHRAEPRWKLICAPGKAPAMEQTTGTRGSVPMSLGRWVAVPRSPELTWRCWQPRGRLGGGRRLGGLE